MRACPRAGSKPMSDPLPTTSRAPDVSREQAEDAVRVLLRWAGQDPAREGLLDTPKRVAKAYLDWFSGYKLDPDEYLVRTFKEVCGYEAMLVLRANEFESQSEPHMAPSSGTAHADYLATGHGGGRPPESVSGEEGID